MIPKKNLCILRDEFLYLNSKGKQVKQKPRLILGGFYFLEINYEGITYYQKYFITTKNLIHTDLSSIKTQLMNKILKQISEREQYADNQRRN